MWNQWIECEWEKEIAREWGSPRNIIFVSLGARFHAFKIMVFFVQFLVQTKCNKMPRNSSSNNNNIIALNILLLYKHLSGYWFLYDSYSLVRSSYLVRVTNAKFSDSTAFRSNTFPLIVFLFFFFALALSVSTSTWFLFTLCRNTPLLLNLCRKHYITHIIRWMNKINEHSVQML